jgi:hypothetical protein
MQRYHLDKNVLTNQQKCDMEGLLEFRCIFCHKLLFKWVRGSFVIEIKCTKCKTLNKITWEKQ